MSSTTIPNDVPSQEHGARQQNIQSPVIRERRGVALRADNRIYLFDDAITALKPAQQFGMLTAYLDPGNDEQHIAQVSLIDARDLLFVATGQDDVTISQQDIWTQAYVQARSALVGLADQLLNTPVGRVLPHRLYGGQEFLETLLAAKEELKQLPVDVLQPLTLYGACVITQLMLTNVLAAYDRAVSLSTWLMTITGGSLFVRAVEDVRRVVKQLPSLPASQEDMPHPPFLQGPQLVPFDLELSPLEQDLFIEQSKTRTDEILRDKDSRRALLLKLLEYAGVFLSIGLANIFGSGVIALAFPIIALFLIAEWRRDNDKIGLNRRFIRNRIERVAFRSHMPWEMYRSIVRSLTTTIRDAQKREKQATFQQLVPIIEPQARELLCLAPDEALPEDILAEVKYASETPDNLLEFATRGVALFMQLLTLIVGCASAFIHVLQAPSPQAWIVAGVAAVFVAIDIYACIQTWKIIRHVR